MPSIALITTGECEHRALGESLQRVFNDVDLEIVTPFRRPVPSITSNYLSYPGPGGLPTHVDRLVASMLAVLDDRRGPDFVFAVDDLELPNVETPHHVTQLVADAFRRSENGTRTHREADRVRSRCSFHLLCPMLEAYFFGEAAALNRAGSTRAPILEASRHLEDFATSDVDFVTPADVREHPWRRPDRQRHPKRYLSFLVDPMDGEREVYKETLGGCAALRSLDWAQVFALLPQASSFAYALFDDVADAIGSLTPFRGAPHPLTRRRSGGTLRNLE